VISTRRLLVLAASAIFATAAPPLLAHHSWPVDFSREITVKGTVTDYSWGNPHVMIGLEVRNENGTIEKWSVGGPSTSRMEGNGWHKDSLKLGDIITGSGYRFSDGQRILRLQKIVMPDGKVMLLYGR
jgi:uncharacterized protein DUF6152